MTIKELKELKENSYKYFTIEESIIAVKQDGYALRYVKEQTHEICLEAVKQDGTALQFVKEQTYEICLEAVKQDGYALQFVKEQTYEICLEAVKQNGIALQYVNMPFDSNEPIEMTIDEIESKLGHKIKITNNN